MYKGRIRIRYHSGYCNETKMSEYTHTQAMEHAHTTPTQMLQKIHNLGWVFFLFKKQMIHSHHTISRLKMSFSTVLSDIMKAKDNHTHFVNDMSILKFCNRILFRLRESSGTRNT